MKYKTIIQIPESDKIQKLMIDKKLYILIKKLYI